MANEMNNDWKEITINTTLVASDLLSDFLIGYGAKGVVLGEWEPDKISEYTKVKAYFPFDFVETKELEENIQKEFLRYQECGLNVGAKEINFSVVKEEDWANSWKQYFHVLHVGKNIVIKPLWEEYEKKADDIVINFDPGMAFGTGTHPSTQLCMEEIESFFDKDKLNYNVLDLGTGSGILSIQMALMGVNKITAVDNDIVAIKASKENFSLNNLDINIFKGSIDDCSEKYDFIAGNILAEIIENLAEGISKKLVDNGIFMGSGIINHKKNDVIKKLESFGLKLKKEQYKGDWVMLVFEKL